MYSRFRRHLPFWRRALRRRRRLLALLALAAAATTVLPSLLPPSIQGVEVIVADQDLPAGTVVGPEHLRTVRTAEQLLPADAPATPEQVLGRTTTSPVPAGTPFLDVLLSGDEHSLIPEGAVLMVVPIPELLAPHLVPGTRIELLPTGASPETRGTLTAQVVEAADLGSATVGLGSTSSTQILVAVDHSHSRELAHALGAGAVMISVIG